MHRHLGLVVSIPNKGPLFIRSGDRTVEAFKDATFAGLLRAASSGAAEAEGSDDFIHQVRLRVATTHREARVLAVGQRQTCRWLGEEGRAMEVVIEIAINDPSRGDRGFMIVYDGVSTTFDLADYRVLKED
jgi:hypothetical protein